MRQLWGSVYSTVSWWRKDGLPEAKAVTDGQQQEKKQEGTTDALNRPKNVKPGERVERGVGVFYRPAL